ncbi:cytochrome P450, partial [Trichophaea hybrida]
YLLALLWNYHIASSAGIPVIIVPFYYQNIFCVNWPYIPGLAWIVNNLLPSSTASYISDIGFTTRFWLRGKRFKTQGLCYFTVSPRNIVLNVADADVVNQIMSDREGFPKPAHKYKIIDMYGSNLLTASDEDWPHHRRYIAGAFNEKNNNLVWEETLLQSGQMLSIWKSRAAPNTTDPMAIDTLNYDAMTMALHVLSSAAFGIPLYFTEATTKRPEAEQGAGHEIFLDTEQPPTGFTMTYRQSILFISQNISSTVGAVMFLPSWMKVVFKHQFAAHRNLGNYLRSIVEETQAKSKYGQDSLLSLMVRATQEDSASRRVGKESGKGFTTQELMGNLFIFTVAGHESTGITLQYTL